MHGRLALALWGPGARASIHGQPGATHGTGQHGIDGTRTRGDPGLSHFSRARVPPVPLPSEPPPSATLRARVSTRVPPHLPAHTYITHKTHQGRQISDGALPVAIQSQSLGRGLVACSCFGAPPPVGPALYPGSPPRGEGLGSRGVVHMGLAPSTHAHIQSID